jgi:hypothetical protein
VCVLACLRVCVRACVYVHMACGKQIRQLDPLGNEPRKLFVVCDYMMNDKNGDGVVSMDEVFLVFPWDEVFIVFPWDEVFLVFL